MPVLKLKTSEIYYEEHGTGYPLLLIAPGFLNSSMERWEKVLGRPDAELPWVNPIEALRGEYRLIAMDQRNAGKSTGTANAKDDWTSFVGDQLALLDHLGVEHCHVMGACIGVSFAFALYQARPGLITSMVLQNPIGLSDTNRNTMDHLFQVWADRVANDPHIDVKDLPAFKHNLFGGDFIFSVPRATVQNCKLPMLLLSGNDQEHPREISEELVTLAPHMETVFPWRGSPHKEPAMARMREFLREHTPRA